jgi:hypothetical protein
VAPAGGKVVLLSIGLPGGFADWCDAVMARLAARLGGEVSLTSWPKLGDMLGYTDLSGALDEVGRTLIRTNGAHLVMGTRKPDERLQAVIAETNTRFIVALDDPRGAVADILAETNAPLRMATRAVANSCPLIMRFAALSGALTLHAEAAMTDPANAVRSIAGHFGIAVTADDVGRIVDELSETVREPTPTNASADWTARIPEAGHKMVDGALSGYRECFASGNLGQLIWTRDLFILVSDPSRAPTQPVDVAGGVRYLVFGPYIDLPSGSWTARVVLGFSPETAGHSFVVDAFAGRQLGATTVVPASGGIYTTEVSFTLGEQSGLGAEIRVMVTSEIARGALAFGRVELRPLATREPDVAPGVSAEFSSVLDL